ncbi:MAG: radical SAM protein [Actinobacteria bacterium]|nr:radical SAM protein [Actinomycetota bacterium]
MPTPAHPEGASYLEAAISGRLRENAESALRRLGACDLCPRACGVDRMGGEIGYCRIGRKARVASAGPHYGEERPLVGTGGSGTIFFSGCNLHCRYCQNSEISQAGRGMEAEPAELAALMLDLQARECENINLVSPTHVIAQILEAVSLAAASGLRLPLVYNTGGYDREDALALLDGVVDIYMPDIKYASGQISRLLSDVPDYPERNREAIKEMHRQVGDLRLDERGVAIRGLLVRHLVLPADLAGTAKAVAFLADEVSTHTYVNIMDQYRPHHQAWGTPHLDRGIAPEEYGRAVAAALTAGLHRLDGRR